MAKPPTLTMSDDEVGILIALIDYYRAKEGPEPTEDEHLHNLKRRLVALIP